MKKLILTSVLASTLVLGSTAQQISFPQPSPTASVSQNFATSKIEINYSRPSVKGRTVFGDVVPFGKLWRTGANGATTVSFGEDVKINGTNVKAGKYGLLTIPNQNEWTVILTKDLNVTSEGAYKQENDAARINVKPAKLNYTVETFTIEVANIKDKACDIEIKWANTAAVLNVTADYDAAISKQIEDAMSKDTRPYFQAANYYFENGKDLNKALAWVNKAVEANPKAFWQVLLKAKIQRALKDYNGAIATAEQGLALAKEASSDPYIKMNETLIAEIKALPDYKPATKKK